MKGRNIFILSFILLMVNISCEEIIERDISKKSVILIAPADSVIIADTVQIFQWDYIDVFADYQLQIVSPKFDSIVSFTLDTIIRKNRFENKLKRKGKYQWRVRPIAFSSAGLYSQPRNFSIE